MGEIEFYKASDLMVKNVITFTEKTLVSEAISILAKNHISGAPVVNSDNEIVGMFTESDILRYFSVNPHQKINLLKVPIIFSKKILTCPEDMPVYLIQQKLMENGYRAIPVVDKKNKLIGMIARRDILKYIFIINEKISSDKR